MLVTHEISDPEPSSRTVPRRPNSDRTPHPARARSPQRQGGFDGIAIQICLAETFYWDYAGELRLVLKLNGKTEIQSGPGALAPRHA
ncbi:hypothetical protein [Amycolatopsis eburnea]|uniref:hypothetical protein n=1 Tax=Amycolatopsis eburnea TaxID=2267691 RepID=UPI001CDBD2D3|nr:hypothetical protein [Amycolatopsis eburnea]